MRKILLHNDMFMLTSHSHPRKKTCYVISLSTMGHWNTPDAIRAEIKKHFGKKEWKTWNRVEAEKQFFYVTLRWT